MCKSYVKLFIFLEIVYVKNYIESQNVCGGQEIGGRQRQVVVFGEDILKY